MDYKGCSQKEVVITLELYRWFNNSHFVSLLIFVTFERTFNTYDLILIYTYEDEGLQKIP